MVTTTYLIYLFLVVIITVLVARTLSKNGGAFLVDSFNGNESLAHSINHLLVVGFYLINLGFALLQLGNHRSINTSAEAIVFLSSKLGFVLVILGVAHFFNLFVISRFKNTQEQKLIRRHREAHAMAASNNEVVDHV